MARGFLKHIWYKLIDEEGIPVSNGNIWLYEYRNPTTELVIFDENGTQITQPITTNNRGVFDFYIKDDIRANSEGSPSEGYEWETQYIISWSKDDKSGIIRGDHLYGEYKSAVISGGTSPLLNRTLSNFYGYTINNHVDFEFGSTAGCGSSSSSSSSTSSSSSSSSSISSSSSSSSSSSESSSSSSESLEPS